MTRRTRRRLASESLVPPQFHNLDGLRSFLGTINPQMAEHPAKFDWTAYCDQARRLAAELTRHFDDEFRLSEPGWIQDSTHSAEISLPVQVLRDPSLVQPAIRISNHEHLVTITCERKVELGALEQMRDIIRHCGYTFVPESVFGEPFDARARHNGDLFNQLFDYT